MVQKAQTYITPNSVRQLSETSKPQTEVKTHAYWCIQLIVLRYSNRKTSSQTFKLLLQKPAYQDYSIFGLVISDGGFSLGSKSITFIASGPANPGEADRWRRTSSFSKFRDGPVQSECEKYDSSYILPHSKHQWLPLHTYIPDAPSCSSVSKYCGDNS